MHIDRQLTKALGPVRFAHVSPRSFRRQSSDDDAQFVELTKPFRVQTTAVTVGQYQRFLDDVGWRPSGPIEVWDSEWKWGPTFAEANSNGPDKPVVGVSFKDASEYLEWARQVDGIPYRLPTEAEFEAAVRSGTQCETTCEHPEIVRAFRADANLARGDGPPDANDSRLENPLGIRGLIGTVWQWCSDWYAPYEGGNVVNPSGPNRQPDVTIWNGEPRAAGRVIRGGSFSYGAEVASCNHRHYSFETDRNFNVGFRVVI